MSALLAMIMGSMLIFSSNKNVFPCPGCYFVLVGSTWRTRRGRAVVSLFSATIMAIFLSRTLFYEMSTAAHATLPLCHSAKAHRRSVSLRGTCIAALSPPSARYSPQWPPFRLTRQGPQTHLNMSTSKCFTCTRNSPCSLLFLCLGWPALLAHADHLLVV